MKLISIGATNFKGLSFSEELNRLTIYGGPNFKGKSARIDAIRLLLLGYLPELGKRNSDTFALSSGPSMSVEGQFRDGNHAFVMRRTWRVDGDSIKLEQVIPPQIREVEESGVLTVMLDANSYFALSDRQRVAYVFAHTTMPPGFAAGEVFERIDFALESFSKESKAELLTRLEREISGPGETTLPERIDAALAASAEIEKADRDHAVRMEKTAQGLAALRLADEKVEADGPLRAEYDRLIERQKSEQSDYAEKKQVFAAIVAARRRRNEIDGELRASAPMAERLADLKRRLEQATAGLATVAVVTTEEANELTDNLNAEKVKEQTALNELRTARSVAAALEGEAAEIDERTSCPYCGAAGDGWKALKMLELKQKMGPLIREIEAKKEAAAAARLAKETLTAALILISAAVARRTEISGAVAGLKDEIANVEKFLARTEGLQAERLRLPAEDPELETAAKMAELQLSKTAQEISLLSQKRLKLAGRSSELTRLAEAELARDKAKLSEAAAKAAAVALRSVKSEIVEKALVPLLASANAFFPGITRTPLAYHDGEIGTFRDSVWVAHHAFSGVEKALAYASIQAALAEQAPVRLMLVDELARIHDEILPEFMAHVVRALEEGRIDGFVGIDPSRAHFYERCTEGIPTFRDGTWLFYRKLD